MDNRLRFASVLTVFLLAGCGKKEAAVPPAVVSGAPTTEFAAAPEKANQPWQKQETAFAPDEVTRNPFLSEEEESEFRDAGRAVAIDYLGLSAILYSSADRSKAILQGRILQKGDSIGDKEIIEIRPEAVILKDAAAEYIVRLKDLGGR